MPLHVGKTARKYLIQECDLQQKRWFFTLEKKFQSHAPPSLTSLKKLKKLEHLVSSSSPTPDGKRVVIETEKWLITIFPAVKHTSHHTKNQEWFELAQV